MSTNNLFEKYGGFASIYPIVSAFYDSILESELVAYMFDSVDMPALVEHQTEFIACVMGGPGTYDDRKLVSAHSKLDISDDEFNEVVSILAETLKNFQIEQVDIDTLLGVCNSKKPLIVTN